jgi:hypothetical protein
MDTTIIKQLAVDLIPLLAGILVNILVVIGAWLKFKTTLTQNTEDIKNHSDVTVQKLNGMLTYVIHSFDRPAWIKVAREENGKTVFRMLEMNELYSEAFGIPRSNYIGKTDLEAGWDHITAERFGQHDLMVWASGEPETFVEIINGKSMRFRKLRIMTRDGKSKGVMGYAVECGDPANCPIYGNISKKDELIEKHNNDIKIK